MAYETGSLSSEVLVDLIEIIKVFADNDGWTIDNWSGLTLQMHADDCYVNLLGRTSDTVNDTYGSTASATSPDHRIEGRLGVDTTPVTVTGQSSRVISNDFLGPYSNYWLFSGVMGEPKYIHFIVQKANGRFCHLSFGNLDKKSATYTGGAFLTGMWWNWWFDSNTPPTSVSSGKGSDIAGAHQFFGDATENVSFATYNIFMGDLQASPAVIHNNALFGNDRLTALMARSSKAYSLSVLNSSLARWLHPIFFLGPSPINGTSAIFEIPVLWWNSTDQRNRFLGTIPGMRYVSMIGRSEVEAVSFVSDDYVIYPFKKALPWNPEPWSTKTITSGPYGYALKKNV